MNRIPPIAFATALALGAASTVASPVAEDARPVRPRPPVKDRSSRKAGTFAGGDHPLLATLKDTHSEARLALDDRSPDAAALSSLLRDPVGGSQHVIDTALLPLVRAVVAQYHSAGDAPEVLVVSGFRSPKLNEALRKKGHEVASHSQHSQGHAFDFRIRESGDESPVDPRELASKVRALGWKGGVGIYLGKDDRFVHVDTGPLRTWYGH